MDETQVRDLVIVGALGPGEWVWRHQPCMAHPKVLMSCCLKPTRPAVRPAASSRIENYLGFPTGISGNDLAGRAYTQAQKFGAQMLLATGTRSHP